MRNRVPSRDRKTALEEHYTLFIVYSLNDIHFSSVSYEFFNELYHRFLLTPKVTMKCLCLQALSIVYGKCFEEIGPFTDTKYIVGMLDRVSAANMSAAVYVSIYYTYTSVVTVHRQTGKRQTHPFPQ